MDEYKLTHSKDNKTEIKYYKTFQDVFYVFQTYLENIGKDSPCETQDCGLCSMCTIVSDNDNNGYNKYIFLLENDAERVLVERIL